MPVIAAVVECKKCGAEVRSDPDAIGADLTELTRLPALANTKPVPRNPARAGIKAGRSN